MFAAINALVALSPILVGLGLMAIIWMLTGDARIRVAFALSAKWWRDPLLWWIVGAVFLFAAIVP